MMENDELLKRTLKTVGAMVGGSVLFVSALSLMAATIGARSSAPSSASETPSTSAPDGKPRSMPDRVETVLPPQVRPTRHATASARPGEAI